MAKKIYYSDGTTFSQVKAEDVDALGKDDTAVASKAVKADKVRPDSINDTYGDAALRYYVVKETAEGHPVINGVAQDGCVIECPWDTTGQWDSQLVLTTSGLAMRKQRGTDGWGEWQSPIMIQPTQPPTTGACQIWIKP